MVQQHAELPDAGRVSHFEIDAWLPAPNEKAALVGDPVPAGDANRYLTQNHAAGGFDGFANPAASVGLVAVNGVATTAMRSDGAPALDQGIVPTLTGLWTFGAGLAVSAGQGIAMADGTWIGGGVALERLVFDLTGGDISVMAANFGVGTLTPQSLLFAGSTDIFGAVGILIVNQQAALGAGLHDGQPVATFAAGNVSSDFKNTLFVLRDTAAGATWTTTRWHDAICVDASYGTPGTDTRVWWERDAFDIIQSWGSAASTYMTLNGPDLGVGTIIPDRLTHAEASTAETVAIAYANRLSHTTSGAAAPLFGVGQEHELEDAGGAMQVASETVTLWAASTAGAESPLYRGTTYPTGSPGPGYWGFWTWNNLDDNARTIVANGAGDVTSGVTIVYRLSESGGGSEGNVVMVANGGTVDLYDDGTDVFTLTVNANGSVTVVRSAGATTADLSLLMCWL